MKHSELMRSNSPGAPHLYLRPPAPALRSDSIAIDCYLNEVPSFIEAELIRLYGSVFSSLAHFRVYGGIERISTYVARKGAEIACVLLFRIEGRRVCALNEIIRLDEREIARFCAYVFSAFPSVRVVSFNAVETAIRHLPFVHQRFNCSEDVALTLPDTAEAYFAQLGKATRKTIKHRLNQARKQFPSLRFEVRCSEDIDAAQVNEIVALNHARMAGKRKTSYLDDEEIDRLLRLVRAGGLVAAITIDGRTCAGTICSCVGGNYFSYVNAHDPAYDAYRLGTLCCYLTICECIARGGREFHLLWGRYEYKYLLAGRQRDLDHLDIYRSRAALWLHAGQVLRNALAAALRQMKFRALDMERKHASGWQRAIAGARRMRRAGLGARAQS